MKRTRENWRGSEAREGIRGIRRDWRGEELIRDKGRLRAEERIGRNAAGLKETLVG